MILVTGANGQLGSQTIDFLLEELPADRLAGLVRSEEKGEELRRKGVETRIGDYNDYPSLENALEEVDTLLLISASSLEGRVEQHRNVIEAAKESPVQHIFYTSIVQADKGLSPLSDDHARTEEMIKDSGISFTFHRHTFYTEFLPYFLGNAMETGEWYFPSGGQKVNLAYRSEMAEALAHVIPHPDDHRNKTYEITSLQSMTLDEMADVLSEAAGRKITYHDVSVEKFEKYLQEAGLPEETVAMSVMTARTFVNGGLNHRSGKLEGLLDREPKTPGEFIAEFVDE